MKGGDTSVALYAFCSCGWKVETNTCTATNHQFACSSSVDKAMGYVKVLCACALA